MKLLHLHFLKIYKTFILSISIALVSVCTYAQYDMDEDDLDNNWSDQDNYDIKDNYLVSNDNDSTTDYFDNDEFRKEEFKSQDIRTDYFDNDEFRKEEFKNQDIRTDYFDNDEFRKEEFKSQDYRKEDETTVTPNEEENTNYRREFTSNSQELDRYGAGYGYIEIEKRDEIYDYSKGDRLNSIGGFSGLQNLESDDSKTYEFASPHSTGIDGAYEKNSIYHKNSQIYSYDENPFESDYVSEEDKLTSQDLEDDLTHKIKKEVLRRVSAQQLDQKLRSQFNTRDTTSFKSSQYPKRQYPKSNFYSVNKKVSTDYFNKSKNYHKHHNAEVKKVQQSQNFLDKLLQENQRLLKELEVMN